MNLKSDKVREVNSYIIFGVLTTVVNIAVFQLFCYFNVDYKISNTIAFIVAVIFAYVTNKIIVFRSVTSNIKELFIEGIKFFSSRIFTYIVEMVLLFILIEKLGIGDFISKIFATGVVVVLNYVLSKIAVFNKGRN